MSPSDERNLRCKKEEMSPSDEPGRSEEDHLEPSTKARMSYLKSSEKFYKYDTIRHSSSFLVHRHRRQANRKTPIIPARRGQTYRYDTICHSSSNPLHRRSRPRARSLNAACPRSLRSLMYAIHALNLCSITVRGIYCECWVPSELDVLDVCHPCLELVFDHRERHL